MNKNRIALLSCLIVCASLTPLYAQDGPPVLRVVAVDTQGNTADYIRLVKPVLERAKQVVPGMDYRIYEAVFAGDETRTVYVAISYPTLQRLAEAHVKVEVDEEYRRLVAALGKTGRTILSDSVLVDRTN